MTFTSSVDLPGVTAAAFGLSQPTTTTETAKQDNPNDPSTASIKKPFSLAHAARATISVDLPANDVDLFIVYDANNDGDFSLSEIIGASAGGTGDESVTLVNPPDGNYQAWVHGFAVAGTPTFPLTIDPIQGTDLVVSGRAGRAGRGRHAGRPPRHLLEDDDLGSGLLRGAPARSDERPQRAVGPDRHPPLLTAAVNG